MPIYEYLCSDCGHQLEALQKISDELLKDCPACGKPALNKMVSAAAFRLKGGGWYETDFKSGRKRNVADSGEPKKSESGDSGKNAATPSGNGGKTAPKQTQS